MVTAICDYCGNAYSTYLCNIRRSKRHFCCKSCEAKASGLNNTRESWIGGCIGKSTGYRYIRVDGKQIGEHILVAERMIGRRLLKDEVVHHINGDKLDNREVNLQVMKRSEHRHLHHILSGESPAFGECNRCGKQRPIKARHLCNNCYSYMCKKGELDKW